MDRRRFLVKADPGQLWRFDPVRDAAGIAGFEIKAFSPEGAAMKVYNRGLASGLKNFIVVEENGVTVTGLYPMRYPLAMLLDAPLDYLLAVLR